MNDAIYNDNDPYVCAWLRNLTDAGHIAHGSVIEGNIKNVDPEQVRDVAQFHAFAGIGTWSYALRLASWPDDIPVWSGSCPCQPFSVAGKRKGVEDARHLWPDWFELIRECRPAIVLGEQVAGADGRAWFDLVFV